uniref:UDP-N-acetylglucosamine transferase subunit ALG13 n=1 Tax=Blastobotrys adeninivorans TaxID=409370 RepID=A0A060T8T1_BLAAD
MSVLVTTGATVPFVELIQSSMSQEMLNALSHVGYSKVVVQYGHGKDHFENAKSDKMSPIEVTGFSFSDNMEEAISKADLVISHAGTGSILDALRANKKLIVVVNEQLMNNHQLEIAEEFEKRGHLLVSGSSTKDLVATIDKSAGFKFQRLVAPNSSKVAAIIDNEAGYHTN